MLRRTFTLALALALAGCNAPEAEVAPEPAPAENPATPEVPDEVEDKALVPSPLEMQAALEASGIETKLATLIPERTFDTSVADPDRAAVRTGAVLADMLLTVKTSDKAALLAQIDAISTGMGQLDGGTDITATLADIKTRVEADAVTRDELLKEFETLSGAVIPELEFNGVSRIVPLIQAGSWLQGTNLVARALKGATEREAASQLLKAPSVVDYFTQYTKTEGENAPEVVTKKLAESLASLKKVAVKTEPLTDEDLDTVVSVTDSVLSLL